VPTFRGSRFIVERLLLVGSQYDAFLLQQAGFRRFGQSWEKGPPGPEFVLARTAAEALNTLHNVTFDLILADQDLPDSTGLELGRQIKQHAPKMPVVVLTSKLDYGRSRVLVPEREGVDYLFIWYGNTALLRAIVHLVEDEASFERHVVEREGSALLLVEDDASFASHYLPPLYEILRTHALELARSADPDDEPSLDEWQDSTNRPLLLYRESYEAACECFERCGSRLIGVISDLEFPRAGALDPRAGLLLTRYVKERIPSVPVIIQSHDRTLADEVHAGIAAFLWKGSDRLLGDLHELLDAYFGFGDFVFRDAAGHEIARGHDITSLAACVRAVPWEVFRYHGSRSHFSAWLSVHGEFELAREARRLSVSDPTAQRRFLELLERRLARG